MFKYLVLIFATAITFVFAQMPDRTSYYSYGTQIYAESHILNSNKQDSSDVILIFKVVYDVLTFNQVNPLENPGAFSATSNLEAIFRDESGIIRRRISYSDTIFVNKFEETNSKNKYVHGQIQLTLANSNYKATIQINEKNLQSPIRKEIDINLKKKNIDLTKFGSAFFGFFPNTNQKEEFSPAILTNNLSFTAPNNRIIIPVSYKEANKSFNYSINKDEDKNNMWDLPVNLSGKANLWENVNLNTKFKINYKEIVYKIENNEKIESDIKNGVLDLEIPANLLVPGKYELIVVNESIRDTQKTKFEVIWEDIPLSLKNVEYAVQSMYYMLNDEQLDEMNSGNDAKMFSKLLAYWKPRDPTPNTPYNEAMAEYFRRIDYAFFNFQTIRERDGSRTERGKIYILYGPPESIESSLANGTTTETWKYPKLNKTFIFSIVSNGIYKLMEIK